MLDTPNNTAENNEEQAADQDNPQRIFEKRLAEINARRQAAPATAQEQPEENTGTEAANNTANTFAGAIAAHEVIPPTLLVPLVEPSPAAAPAAAAAPDAENTPLAAETSNPNIISSTEDLPIEISASDPQAVSGGTSEFSAVPYTIQPPVEDSPTADQDSISVTERQPPVQPATTTSPTDTREETTAPEMMSTAGIIPETADTSAAAPTVNPEAATTEAIGEEPASQQQPVSEHDLLMDEEHPEELVHETDYSTLSTGEVRYKLMQVLRTATRSNARQVNELNRQYEAKLAADKANALDRFITEGGAADDFEYQPGPEHQEFEKAYQQYREARFKEQRQDEEQKIKNARRKQELLDQLRELVESPETKSSADKIRHIQTEWKGIGPVPAAESKQLWNSYHALLDIFYNNRSIFFELKELDRRKNLQYKLQLCERAESLIGQPSINTALQELRNLHEEWKNVGPVPNEYRDSIWERFIQASEKVHARKKEFIAERKSHELDNLFRKTELLSRIETYQNFQTDRINDWRDKTDEIQKLKEEWDAIGLVPKEKADEINKRFWSNYKAFFNHKNTFFKNLDEQKMQNMRLKTELCEQAESLKDSTDWDETKEKLIQLQKKWKTIGRIPDKYSEKLWQRFRTACNEFFDRKQNQVQQREAEHNQVSQQKNAYYEHLASRMTSLDTYPGTYAEFEQLLNQWLAIPPTKTSAKIDDRFFDLLQKYAGSITELSQEERTNLLVNLQVIRLKQSPDASNRIHQKEQAIRRDISQLENDIRTLKTNIEFFGRSKNAEKLREEYQSRIEEADNRIQQLQKQLFAFRNN